MRVRLGCESGRIESDPLGTGMTYRVQLVPRRVVMDHDGLPVASSHVVDIALPGDAIETAPGRLSTIIGPGTAKVLVIDTTIQGVRSC